MWQSVFFSFYIMELGILFCSKGYWCSLSSWLICFKIVKMFFLPEISGYQHQTSYLFFIVHMQAAIFFMPYSVFRLLAATDSHSVSFTVFFFYEFSLSFILNLCPDLTPVHFFLTSVFFFFLLVLIRTFLYTLTKAIEYCDDH